MLEGNISSPEQAGTTVFKDERKRAFLNPEGADRRAWIGEH
jgi:hypothetical protein